VFNAFFTEGRDIGQIDVLADLAVGLGLGRAETLAFLHGTEETEAVQAENLRAHRMGINGVPCLILSGRHAISGAQEAEVISRLFDVAVLEVAGE